MYQVEEAAWSRSRGEASKRNILKKRALTAGERNRTQSSVTPINNAPARSTITSVRVGRSNQSSAAITTPIAAWKSRRPGCTPPVRRTNESNSVWLARSSLSGLGRPA